MTAAENRRRIARDRAGADAKQGLIALADSAELLHAARLFPKIGTLLDRQSGSQGKMELQRLELRRGR